MSKELPYFKFFPEKWLLGTINAQTYKLKGQFIDVCAYYWNRECRVTLSELKKRFPKVLVSILIQNELILIENDFVIISFLKEQKAQVIENQAKIVEGGRKGGLRSAQGRLKAGSSIKDIDKEVISTTDVVEEITNPKALSEEEKNLLKEHAKKLWASPMDIEYIMKNFKITQPHITNLLRSFVEHLTFSEDRKPKYKDFKSHFVNWLRIKQSKGEFNTVVHIDYGI